MLYIIKPIDIVNRLTIIKAEIGVAYDGDPWFMIGLLVKNIDGNMLLLMPLGYLVPILWKKFKRKQIILLGLCVSILIEFLQFWEIKLGAFSHVTDIDEVIFNVLGVFVGYLFYRLTTIIIAKLTNQISSKIQVKA
ncbi:VanZ family protein [Robertmurraya sp. P23]|uniref:VanZ family protein n=1 Tax=Robertmurraya sp. P23 TaxID=3436931 RepID=UPI003D998B0D